MGLGSALGVSVQWDVLAAALARSGIIIRSSNLPKWQISIQMINSSSLKPSMIVKLHITENKPSNPVEKSHFLHGPQHVTVGQDREVY